MFVKVMAEGEGRIEPFKSISCDIFFHLIKTVLYEILSFKQYDWQVVILTQKKDCWGTRVMENLPY